MPRPPQAQASYDVTFTVRVSSLVEDAEDVGDGCLVEAALRSALERWAARKPIMANNLRVESISDLGAKDA